jgi:hypothetical protein
MRGLPTFRFTSLLGASILVSAATPTHALATGSTQIVSHAPSGASAAGQSTEPSISADGRHVAYVSSASNIVPGDANGHRDVFVWDASTGQTRIAGGSVAFGAASAGDPPLSSSGGIAFTGGSRFYQVWYRNTAAFCTTDPFNLTNGVEAIWEP